VEVHPLHPLATPMEGRIVDPQ